MAAQQFCLKWNNHTNNMLEIFNTLLSTEALVDVTLACDGLSLKAHKIVLSACSPFFQSLFLENPCQHPIVIMKDIPYKDLKAIVDFMYRGEVNVSQDQLSGLLRTAETLKVKGLADENRGVQQEVSTSQNSVVPPSTSTSTSQQRRADSPPLHAKRKKGRPRKRSLSDSNRSDDEMGPAKIKEPNSPEIEELSEDAILDEGRSDSMIRQRSSSSQRRIRSSVNTSFSSKSLTPSNAHIEEPPSGEEEFELEPSKLLEQTLTTDAASSVSNTALTSTMPVNFNLPSSSGIEISQIGSDSQALVPVAGTSDSSHLQGPDSPPDIKPTITTFDESQSDSMMYMDQSSLPGPSNYQDNSMMQGDEQPQEESSDKNIEVGIIVFDVVTVPDNQSGDGKDSSKEIKTVPKSDVGSVSEEKDAELDVNDDIEDHIEKLDTIVTSRRDDEKGSSMGIEDDVKSDLLDLPKKSGDGFYHCQLCSYSSAKRYNVVMHNRSHTGERPYECTICYKSFTRKGVLKQHLYSHIESDPNKDIEKDVIKAGVLKVPRRNDDGLYYCQICPYTSDRRHNMVAHIRVHTGERLYQCPVCFKSFTTKGVLSKHLLKHCGNDSEEEEEDQRKEYIIKPSLRHAPPRSEDGLFHCDICQYSTDRRHNMVTHIRVHTGERPFQCAICWKSYSRKGALKQHVRTHENPKLFKPIIIHM